MIRTGIRTALEGRLEGVTDDPILSPEMREEIISNFELRLRTRGNSILDNADTREQMLSQARSILDDVVDNHTSPTGQIDPSSTSLNVETEASQAIKGIRLTESLHAASVLFETALQRAFSAAGRQEVEATLVLHHLIMRQVTSTATSHAGLMLRTIRESHRSELARLARDLHDHAAHAIGVAIQNLELHEMHARRDAAKAQDKLHLARRAMRAALERVRDHSVELRMTVTPDRLEQALTNYLATNAASDVLTRVEVTGDTAMLPEQVSEELYVTLREAIRNALVHSHTTRLDVMVRISASVLRARVSDTGLGFPAEETTRVSGGLGLSSMRERVQLLGGTLRLSSLPGQGTTVEISIPLPRASP